MQLPSFGLEARDRSPDTAEWKSSTPTEEPATLSRLNRATASRAYITEQTRSVLSAGSIKRGSPAPSCVGR
jgi:hypothetical protein